MSPLTAKREQVLFPVQFRSAALALGVIFPLPLDKSPYGMIQICTERPRLGPTRLGTRIRIWPKC